MQCLLANNGLLRVKFCPIVSCFVRAIGELNVLVDALVNGRASRSDAATHLLALPYLRLKLESSHYVLDPFTMPPQHAFLATGDFFRGHATQDGHGVRRLFAPLKELDTDTRGLNGSTRIYSSVKVGAPDSHWDRGAGKMSGNRGELALFASKADLYSLCVARSNSIY